MNEEEELLLRESIRTILLENLKRIALTEAKAVSSSPDAPYDITAMNFLSTLINDLIKNIETSYKSLTTGTVQRESFAAHILNGVEELLTTADATPEVQKKQQLPIDEEIDIDFQEDGRDPFEDEGIIKIDDDEKEESEEERFASKLSQRGLDMTGRNKAYDTFRDISKQILTTYNMIDPDSVVPASKVPSLGRDTPEREVFKIYLMKNLELYMKRFEEELQAVPDMPDIPV